MRTGKYITLAVNFSLLAAGIFCTGLGCLNLLNRDPVLASTGLTAGLIFLFSATIERFESIKGLGLEAKTRELSEKLGEAKHAVSELKQLAEISGHTLSLLAARVGRWDSAFSFEESYTLSTQIKDNLRSLNCSDISIKQAIAPWVKVTIQDLARTFTTPIHQASHAKTQELHEKIRKTTNTSSSSNSEITAILEKINEITKYYENAVNDIQSAEPHEVISLLEKFISNAPGVDQPTLETHLSVLKSWTPEIENLISTGTVIDFKRWCSVLARS